MATVEPRFGLREPAEIVSAVFVLDLVCEPAEVVGDGSAKATGVGFTVQQFSA
jgi:hypothetical protein